MTSEGTIKSIDDIEEGNYNENKAIYNLNIEENYTYYVSELEVLVHNDCTKEMTEGSEANKVLDVRGEYNEIDKYREKLGVGPYTLESGNTVACINLDGERFFGVNSTITKESQDATKALRQKWFEKIQWVPPKKKQPLHLGYAKFLTHG